MPVSATPTNPTSVYELQVFTRTLTLSTSCTLLGYTVFAPSQSVILITISSTTLTISGYYDNIFNLQEWRYRTDTNDSTEYTTSVYYGSLPSVYYKATGYKPDIRTSSSIAINVRTSQGDLDFLHFVKNDWNQKRNRVLDFIRGSTIDAEERQIDIELDLPAGTITGGGGTSYNYAVTLSTNTENYNLKTAALAAGWVETLPLNATITVANGVYVWSDTTSTAAFATGSTFPVGSTISIVNNGFIIGKGGNGGNANSLTAGYANAFNGGPALDLNYSISLTNNGYVAGGGGGGGGANGGGGGGGAGGGRGGSNLGVEYPAQPGGAGGAPGQTGANGPVTSAGNYTRSCAGGGGGRILPGVGGATLYGGSDIVFAGNGTPGSNPTGGGRGGGAGGGAGPSGNSGGSVFTFSGAGGSANNAAANTTFDPSNGENIAAGGGGWGAAGGTANQFQGGGQSGPKGTGGAGGKAIALNGYTVTYAATGTIYGAVS